MLTTTTKAKNRVKRHFRRGKKCCKIIIFSPAPLSEFRTEAQQFAHPHLNYRIRYDRRFALSARWDFITQIILGLDRLDRLDRR